MKTFVGRRCFIIVVLVAMASGGCSGKQVLRTSDVPEGISFSVYPSDAEVLIDHVSKGKAVDFPADHPLIVPVGVHILELRAPGYAEYSRRLTVSLQPKRIEATLPRKEESATPKDKIVNGSAPASVPGK